MNVKQNNLFRQRNQMSNWPGGLKRMLRPPETPVTDAKME